MNPNLIVAALASVAGFELLMTANPLVDALVSKEPIHNATQTEVQVTDTNAAPFQIAAKQKAVFTNQAGVAINGIDPVAYFQASKPVAGKPEFSHQWMGATWHFSSATNRDKFAESPASYAPQYGGYCAWAVSQGYTAPTVPEAWKIVDGKLYLNFDKNVQSRWEQDISGNITKANKNWPQVLN
ncbi:MAG: YHS domain-containing (seleno)protein [Microcoleaceae cyanobacterium]